MKMEIGVWIDHRQAVIVTLLEEKEEIRRIRSNIERHSRYWSVSQTQNATGSPDNSADDAQNRRLSNRMRTYFDAVIQWLSTADSIMIFGPGESKNELQNRLLHHELSGRIVSVQTTDKLTVREFATEVRQQFARLQAQTGQEF